ncbi:MAG TPA: isoprenylcysteine carboxylmethyltransferase family protein [Bauldia sp.]|nr:isoprenylcysteine carboxylmethyltransferase family protein [Bauldia sp.]
MSQTNSTDTAGVTILPPLIYVGGLVIGYILQLLIPFPIVPPVFDVAVRLLGVVVLFAGGWLVFTGAGSLQAAGTPMNPHEPSKTLVFAGPYKFTRNPMYLGMTLLLVGFAFIGNALWPLLAAIPAVWWIQTQVIAREEAYLEAKFGAPYLDFKKRVRRWI